MGPFLFYRDFRDSEKMFRNQLLNDGIVVYLILLEN